MSLNIYFLRHGQTASSQANLFCGTIDPPLTTHGAEMARSFATAYASTPWAAIYSSPRERAISTATPLAMAVKMELQIRAGLAEIDYGAWEGQDVATVERQYHDDYLRWLADPGWNPPTNGEPAIAGCRACPRCHCRNPAAKSAVLGFPRLVVFLFGGNPRIKTPQEEHLFKRATPDGKCFGCIPQSYDSDFIV